MEGYRDGDVVHYEPMASGHEKQGKRPHVVCGSWLVPLTSKTRNNPRPWQCAVRFGGLAGWVDAAHSRTPPASFEAPVIGRLTTRELRAVERACEAAFNTLEYHARVGAEWGMVHGEHGGTVLFSGSFGTRPVDSRLVMTRIAV